MAQPSGHNPGGPRGTPADKAVLPADEAFLEWVEGRAVFAFRLLRVLVVLGSAVLTCIVGWSIFVGSYYWWLSCDAKHDEFAREATQPLRYIVEHPPSGAVLGFSAGLLFFLVFFETLEHKLKNLTEGMGFKVDVSSELKRRNPPSRSTGNEDGD